MNTLYGLSITAKKDEILATLKKNRASHRAIVEEARKAYVDKAKSAVERKLELLRSGKVVSLTFALQAPLDYTTVYDTAIRALELHTGDTIELSADQVRNLIDDHWDWSNSFTSSNAMYSETLRKKLTNFDSEE